MTGGGERRKDRETIATQSPFWYFETLLEIWVLVSSAKGKAPSSLPPGILFTFRIKIARIDPPAAKY
jgi:hypothetical protein